jgi:hypothetical protein
VLAPFAAAAALWACEDPFAPKADQPNSIQSFAASALTGTPTNAPAALQFVNKAITRIDGGLDFDLAFDIDKQNRPVLLPLGMVGTPVGGARLVGLQRMVGNFDSVTAAPKSGYVFDSVMVVKPGAVIAVQAQESVCSLSLTPYIFAKIVIDSLNLSTRTLYGHTLINLNCGFRQLTPGTPTF